MTEEQWTAPAVGVEFRGAHLGDARRVRRLVSTAQACAQAPQKSLPRALTSKTALEATYVLFGNEAVDEQAILQPHRDQTRERCAQAGTVLMAHDTSEFVFSTHREGLGHLRSLNDHGFLMHASLAITADGNRRPLGVMGAHFWTRSLSEKQDESAKDNGKTKRGKKAKRVTHVPLESERWFRQAVQSEIQLGSAAQAIHLMDREGDSYELMAKLLDRNSRFIIRNRVDRIARSEDEGPNEHVRHLCEQADAVFETSIPIARRDRKAIPERGKSLAPREARVAKLLAKAVTIQLRKPPYLRDLPMWIDINVVHVTEIDAPPDVEPVQWTLMTTEPIDNPHLVITIVEHYRTRWLIEEWFKAIKTGCQVEKLQLETYASLKNATAMYLVIAWRMLLLRALARSEPNAPAEVALSPSEIVVLRQMQPDAKLPPRPTVGQVYIAVAMMGGYIKHKIQPGWLALARGMESLILLERGWSAARSHYGNGRDP